MFRLENPIYLQLLWLIPIFLLLFWLSWRWRKRILNGSDNADLISRLMPDRSRSRMWFRAALFCLTIAFTIGALVNPQIGSKLERVERSGIDVMICLDLSMSMLAEDLQPNRLERAKQFINRLLDEMPEDRVGLIVFAGHAYLQMPVSADHSAAKLFLKAVDPGLMSTQGTAIGEAIQMAMDAFDEENNKHQAILIISDGEDHEGEAVEAAQAAGEKGVVIHTLGIGSLEGAGLPAFDMFGRRRGNKVNNKGQEIISKLNPAMLGEVATAGNGRFFHIQDVRGDMQAVKSALSALEGRKYGDQVVSDYDDKYQYFIAFALLFLLIDMLLTDRSKGWSDRFRFEQEQEQTV